MFKKILFHALVGGVIFIIGAVLYDFTKIKDLGDFLAYGGMVYAACSTVLILIGVNIPSPIGTQPKSSLSIRINSLFSSFNKDRVNTKAREELLSYKKLLNEGIITEEEFNLKASKLKKLIL